MTPLPQRIPIINQWMIWIKPHATDKDAAFRETTIRITVGVLLIALSVSLFLQVIAFYASPTALPLTTMEIITVLTCLVTISAVQRQKLIQAGQVLAATFIIITISLAVTFGWTSPPVAPVLSLTLITSTLFLPKQNIPLIAIIALGGIFIVGVIQAQYPPFVTSLEDLPRFIVLVLLFVTALICVYLYQLRGEFDNRLAATNASLVQTQAANQRAEQARLEAERARQEAERARHDAEYANKAKSQFLANMSHELRTPLNAIIGYAEIILAGMDGDVPDKIREHVAYIDNNGTRLLSLINDILDLSRIEANRSEVKPEEIDPRTTVTRLIESMQSIATKKALTLAFECQPSTPTQVTIDPQKLQQVLVNLVGNALKFTNTGSVTVRTGSDMPTTWFLQVQDTGIGIPEDQHQKIFKIFEQVDNQDTRIYQGSGLGLAITDKHVTRMGGSIKVESKVGSGSTFTITFPRIVVKPKEQ